MCGGGLKAAFLLAIGGEGGGGAKKAFTYPSLCKYLRMVTFVKISFCSLVPVFGLVFLSSELGCYV